MNETRYLDRYILLSVYNNKNIKRQRDQNEINLFHGLTIESSFRFRYVDCLDDLFQHKMQWNIENKLISIDNFKTQ